MGQLIHRRSLVEVIIIFLLSFLICYGCRGKDGGALSRLVGDEDRTGGEIVLTLESPFPEINPLSDRSRQARSLYYFIYDNLVDYDENLHIVPRLAKSWEWSNEGKSIIFLLRDDVRWHNDALFTATDVISSWRQYRKLPDLAQPERTMFADVENVSSISPYIVRVDYYQPRAAALADWVVEMLPSPDKLAPQASSGAPAGPLLPVGSGPYRMSKVDLKLSNIELRAYDGYWNGRPYLNTIFIQASSPGQAMASFLENKTDYFLVPDMNMNREQLSRLKKDGEVHDVHGLTCVFIGWRSDGTNIFFAHRRIRKAIGLGIDREKLLNTLFDGHGALCDAPIPLVQAGGSIKPLSYSPRLAVDLLREVGCKDVSGNGVREMNGQDFRFSLMYPDNNRLLRATALFIQDNLRKIGISVTPLELPLTEYSRRYRAGQFDAFIQEMDIPMDFSHLSLFVSQSGPRTDNVLGFRDKLLSNAITELATTINHEARQRKLETIIDRIMQEQPCTYLYYRPRLAVIRRNILEVKSSPRGIWEWYPSFLEWYLPSSMKEHRRPGPR